MSNDVEAFNFAFWEGRITRYEDTQGDGPDFWHWNAEKLGMADKSKKAVIGGGFALTKTAAKRNMLRAVRKALNGAKP